MVLQIHFTFKPFPSTCKRERKQKKERAQRTKREREREKERAQRTKRRSSHEPNADPALRRSISPLLDLASAQSRLRPMIFDPPISLCDFDFCCCYGGVVVALRK